MKNFALVTGASKGIGRAIAFSLARRNYNLLLVARSENELKLLRELLIQKYGISVEYFVTDLSQREAAKGVANWLSFNNFEVSVLVNNAGYGLWGDFSELDLTEQLNMVQLNVNTLVELSHYIIPYLKKHSKSYILNVSSTAAYQAVPTLALYAASKSFVLSFTRALRHELREGPISVTCICPGPVDTGFAERAGLNALSKMAQAFNMKPEEVAEFAVRGMLKGRAEVIPGPTNFISAFATRLLPKNLIENAAAGIYKLQ
ncbi:SDR family NAD(P)-dependent oxidoreductase [Desertivirga arenae]|uniref:SDR family NAD(P)-dependent oxidoreductase n=1 Tax=Desertivirga arenae TaxID=2810309 RepID=UPI001A976009|nr:SDR family oxidoreductase [Pedobacter sp. SYSU D00823]